jgi:DNA primase large subunit
MGILVDPLAPEAKELVKKSEAIIDLPEEVFILAEKKIRWKKTTKRPPRDLIELEPEKDVLSYYILFLIAGINYSPYSNEVKLVKEVVYQITKARLIELAKQGDEKLITQLKKRFEIIRGEVTRDFLKLDNTLIEKKEIYAFYKNKIEGPLDNKRVKKYGVPWRTLLPLLKNKEIKLSDWYIKNSNAILSLLDMIEIYSRLVALEALEEISKIRKPGRKIEIDKLERLSNLLSSISKTSYKVPLSIAKPGKFVPENFPPCIKSVLNGVSTGSRNYAISVLLTSFLSYARAAPSNVQNPKISDFIKDPAILTEEIMPLIYEAAERCEPPLFEDQPIEKLNIAYHLGLGLTEEVKLENAGASKWYFPPNCEKIQRDAPALCMPDEFCGKIKNPLNYYFLKNKISTQKEEGARREVIVGKIIKIHPMSGLIERCPQCRQRVINNRCIIHGNIHGQPDLRIKATLVQDNTLFTLIFNKEVTENILGIDLEKAIKIGRKTLLNIIKERLLENNFEVSGRKVGKNFLVQSINSK